MSVAIATTQAWLRHETSRFGRGGTLRTLPLRPRRRGKIPEPTPTALNFHGKKSPTIGKHFGDVKREPRIGAKSDQPHPAINRARSIIRNWRGKQRSSVTIELAVSVGGVSAGGVDTVGRRVVHIPQMFVGVGEGGEWEATAAEHVKPLRFFYARINSEDPGVRPELAEGR